MRLRVLIHTAVVLALAGACSSAETVHHPEEIDWDVPCPTAAGDTTAADFGQFTLECLSDGKDHQLGDLDGRPMVITLWASWCGPCRDEAPAFKKFHAELGDEIDLIGVDTQDTRSAAVAFADDAGWRFPSVLDEKGGVMKSQGITALPATFFIDAEGATVETYNEGELTTERLLATAEKHFGVTP